MIWNTFPKNPNKVYLRFRLRTLLILFAIASVVLCTTRMVYLAALPVPPHKVAQLKFRMTKSEVRKILGKPDELTDHSWSYDTFFNIGWVNVYFDDAEKLSFTDPEPTEFYYSYP